MAEQDWKELYKQQLHKKDIKEPTTIESEAGELDPPASKTVKTSFKADKEPLAETELRMESPQTASSFVVNWAIFVRIASVMLIGVSLIQCIIWIAIGVFGNNFQNPWWLWTAGPSALLIGLLHYIGYEVRRMKRIKS